MMPENHNNSNGDNEPLQLVDNNNDDRLPDTSNSDAAAENAGETERILEKSVQQHLLFIRMLLSIKMKNDQAGKMKIRQLLREVNRRLKKI